MRVLAIDTVTEMCSVAVSVDGEHLQRQEMAINRHSGMVLDMVDSALAEAGVSLRQLDLIINDVGPGSFTGIRIGMGVAQGLAYGADLPVLGVDSLATLAQGVSAESGQNVFTAIDARMNQIYYGLFSRTATTSACVNGLHLSDPTAVKALNQPVYAVGSGWDAYRPVLESKLNIAGSEAERFPLAQHGLAYGLTLDESQWVEAGAMLPVYLRNEVAKISHKSLV